MTKSKRKKRVQKILDALSEKAPLSTNRGKLIGIPQRKPTPKQRRHSGWRTPQIVHPSMKFSEMIENALEPSPSYDDWLDFRDGMRHSSDKTHFFRKWRGCCLDEEEVFKINKKIKKQRAIRKASKGKNSGNRNRTCLISDS